MKRGDFLQTLQRKVTITAVGPSAVRGQGKGVLRASQDFLSQISLSAVPKHNSKQFNAWLDRQTNALLDRLPVKSRPWGVARKVINLFLREALYNQYLNKRFHLDSIESWLEIPLDRAGARGLKSRAGKGVLPPWPGLKNLQRRASAAFQDFASTEAARKQIARVHLDMYLWLENR